MNGFELTKRNVAVNPPEVPVMFSNLMKSHSVSMLRGDESVAALGAFWGDEDNTKMIEASLETGTIAPLPLTDGRVSFRCLWSESLGAAFDAGEIEGVEELGQAELDELKVEEVVPD